MITRSRGLSLLLLALLALLLQKSDPVGLKALDTLLALCSPSVPAGSSSLQLLGWNVTCLKVCFESIFVPSVLPTTGAGAVCKLAVEGHFWDSVIVHTDHMAHPS